MTRSGTWPAIDVENVEHNTSALLQRLSSAARVLAPEFEIPDIDAFTACSLLLDRLMRAVRAAGSRRHLWLLLTALTGEFPLHQDLERVRRELELASDADAVYRVLDECFDTVSTLGVADREMDIISDKVVVLVDFCARHNLMTGVQRVVRHTLPHWMDGRPLVLAAWTVDGAAFCNLTETETARVVQWHLHEGSDPDQLPPPSGSHRVPRLIVPWDTTVIVPEVPDAHVSERLASLARHSGSGLALVGYDCIPVASAELVAPAEHEKFMSYLEVVKHASLVAGISEAAASEFRGFTAMVKAQGVPGPTVTVCPLPTGSHLHHGDEPGRGTPVLAEPADAKGRTTGQGLEPSVVCVGSVDRRKNQIVVLEAAERLWRTGHRFSVRFLGSGGLAPPDFAGWLAELIALGRPVSLDTYVSDRIVHDALAMARFSVFPSLHEGFGLPVIESLSLGVPAITADRGSLREITEGDGALHVDPTDADAVTEAMRQLLTDDGLYCRLRRQALARRRTSWLEYAQDLWRQSTESDMLA